MELDRIKKLAGIITEAEKSAVDGIKNGTLTNPKKHDAEDYDVVQDKRGNVKVGDEKTKEEKDGEPAAPKKEGKLKLKEMVEELMDSKKLDENSIAAAKEKRVANRAAAEKQAAKDGKDKRTKSYSAWRAMCSGAEFDGDEDCCRAESGGRTIGDWDADEGGIVYNSPD